MAQSAVVFSREAYNDFLKMRAEWKRAIKSEPLPRGRYPVGAVGENTWIGILSGSLAYGSSATAKIYKWDGSSGFTDSGTTDTVYPWMMNTGDSIGANVEVVGGKVNGKRVVFNAACKNIYGS